MVPDIAWSALHLLRPHWLWALLALPLGLGAWWLRRRRAQGWRDAVDPHLLPRLLVAGGRRSWLQPLGLALAYALAVLAMAGPSWRQSELPLFRSQMPLVIALDLSSSVMAGDLPPSRLLQVRAKLATLLRERRGGDVALLAYAGESFTVAPLTEDAANVALFLDALGPDVMPVDGKRADRAIESALGLLAQAGFARGDILLLTDSADGRARALAAAAARRGYRVSALGVGSPRGGAYRDGTGHIAQARLDEPSLRALAGEGRGRYARLQAGDADLRALDVLAPSDADGATTGDARGGVDWLDDGYWLLLPVMLLVLPVFRRRAALVLLGGSVVPLLLPPAAQAAEGTWWRRADQVVQQRTEVGVDAYRRGDFAAARQAFEGDSGADAQYNLGNALARQGEYDAAIAAYDRALARQPGMPDAVANRATVDAARKRRQSQRGQDQDQSQRGTPQASQNQQSQQNQQNQQRSGQPGPQAGDRQQAAPRAQGEPQKGSGQDTAAQAEDRQAQREADQAHQQRMRQALQQRTEETEDPAPQASGENAQQREQRQAVEAWMRRVPDDPGSLLRSKFRLEHERRQREGR